MTWKRGSRERTRAASSNQREVIQAHGQTGSNQKSTTVGRSPTRCLSPRVPVPKTCETPPQPTPRPSRRPAPADDDEEADTRMPGNNLTRDEAQHRARLVR